MSVGARIGARVGTKIGARVGSPAGGAHPLAGIPRDALSGWMIPATTAHWNLVHSYLGFGGAPILQWGCQDASGGAAAQIGSINLDAEAPGTRLDYQQTISGWTRKAILSRGDALISNNAGLPDPATTSVMAFAILIFEAAAVTNDRITIGAANRALLQTTTTPVVRVVNSTNIQDGAVTIDSAAHGHILKLNQTADTVSVISDLETQSVAKIADPTKEISFVGSPVPGRTWMLLGTLWSGANAEISNAQAASLISLLKNPPT